MKIMECVPNFSEGRDAAKLKAIAEVLENCSGVRFIDYSGDTDHNRSVYTFLGEPGALLAAALAACGKALELIDMRHHQGVHPRLGAVDVVPFIPLADSPMQDAVDLAHRFGREFNERFAVPVYFYGAAALQPERRELADVRRGGYEGLRQKMMTPEGTPDVGNRQFNERAGATAVGARKPLVAFNINLNSGDLALACRIASRIREKNGGLKHVRAMGVMLQVKGRKIAQVSINLTDCDEMPLKNIYDLVRTIAAADGVEILESELIGLMPGAALRGATPEELKIRNFSQHCLLETHLRNFRRR